MRNFSIAIYQDGENESVGQRPIIDAWKRTWEAEYGGSGRISFGQEFNLKQQSVVLPPKLTKIAAVRNPDIYFAEETTGLELGGVEITDHSPDGSNADKRYPYLWISRREGVNGFITFPYAKERLGTGRSNRFPFRHAKRNLQLLESELRTSGYPALWIAAGLDSWTAKKHWRPWTSSFAGGANRTRGLVQVNSLAVAGTSRHSIAVTAIRHLCYRLPHPPRRRRMKVGCAA